MSAAKQKIARATGIPTTRAGRQRKIGAAATKGCAVVLAVPLVGIAVLGSIIIHQWL